MLGEINFSLCQECNNGDNIFHKIISREILKKRGRNYVFNDLENMYKGLYGDHEIDINEKKVTKSVQECNWGHIKRQV